MGERVGSARLEFFGRPRLTDASGHDVALPRMGFALALYLLVGARNRQATRAELADFLWPNSRTSPANLRQLLARLRAVESDLSIFLISEDHVQLTLGDVWCDVVDFQKLAERPELASADRLLDLFGTGLFADVRVEGSETPGAWITAQAETMRRIAIHALSELLQQPDAPSNPAAIRALSMRLLEIDPYCEAAWETLVKSYARTGQIARLEQTYEQYRGTLRQDLGERPSAKMEELFLRLSSGSRRRGPSLVPGEPRGPLRPIQSLDDIPRFVALAPRGSSTSAEPMRIVADLLIEDVTIGLCSVRSIDVVAPHTAWQLGDGLLDEAAVARFRVGYVLDTRVIEISGDTKLVLKLYETSGRSILWADRVGLSEATSEACYRNISIGVIAALADAIDLAEQARYEREPHPTAYYWYLIGQHHLKRLDLPNVRRARKAFERAIKANPDFAPAYSGRSRSLHREWLLLGRDENELLLLAHADGLQSTRLDPKDAKGFREVGLTSLYLRRFDDSLENYSQAGRLSPWHADLIADHADALAHAGRPDDGFEKMCKAFKFNPLPPDQYWWDLGGIQFQLRQYREAIETIGNMQKPPARLRLMAACWAMLGERERARKCAEEFLETYPAFRVDQWLRQVPNRNVEDTNHYERGLRAAGFQ